MDEFWESAYNRDERMWGENPTDNAKRVLELFQRNKVESVLIPGFGYGRNAKVFFDNGFQVSGIEISKTAIKRARKYFGDEVIIHHGSVTEMPFNQARYDAIYCYSLIHLLEIGNRIKLIEDCYVQLKPEGIMVFVALSIRDKRFGVGDEIDTNTFKSPHGLSLYFYDEATIREEFEKYNILSLTEIKEPEQNPNEIHWMIVCKK